MIFIYQEIYHKIRQLPIGLQSLCTQGAHIRRIEGTL
jgi:hypothetical protein